jgi:alkyl hydroperoxide reductase subunit AhpC
MSLHIGDTAPDFTADTTKGEISFHKWAADSWVFFFSHPADFTPVCATQYSSANPEWPHSGSPGPLFRARLCYL